MARASDFVDTSTGAVEWARLARTLVGATFGAFFTGVASVILGVSDLPIAVLEWLGEFGGRLVELVAGIPARIVGRSWAGVAEFIDGSGPIAFVLGIAFILLTMYAVVRIARFA